MQVMVLQRLILDRIYLFMEINCSVEFLCHKEDHFHSHNQFCRKNFYNFNDILKLLIYILKQLLDNK